MSNGAISQAEYNKLFNIVDEIKKENILKMIAKPSLEEVRLMLDRTEKDIKKLKYEISQDMSIGTESIIFDKKNLIFSKFTDVEFKIFKKSYLTKLKKSINSYYLIKGKNPKDFNDLRTSNLLPEYKGVSNFINIKTTD